MNFLSSRKDHAPFLLLCLLIVLASIMSEYWKRPHTSLIKEVEIDNPIPISFLLDVSKISLKNKLGEVQVEKSWNQALDDDWFIINPRKLLASSNNIQKLLSDLKDIKVKSAVKKDPLTLSNFSLDRPLSEIKIINQLGDDLIISFGIYNPIIKSMYLTTSKSDYIYQIFRPEIGVGDLTINYFIESRIFNFDINSITAMRVSGAVRKQFDDKESFPSSYLESIHSHMILDQIDEKIEIRLDSLLSRPFLNIQITTKDNKNIEIRISNVISFEIPELKLEKRKFVVIKSSLRNQLIICKKEIWNEFISLLGLRKFS